MVSGLVSCNNSRGFKDRITTNGATPPSEGDNGLADDWQLFDVQEKPKLDANISYDTVKNKIGTPEILSRGEQWLPRTLLIQDLKVSWNSDRSKILVRGGSQWNDPSTKNTGFTRFSLAGNWDTSSGISDLVMVKSDMDSLNQKTDHQNNQDIQVRGRAYCVAVNDNYECGVTIVEIYVRVGGVIYSGQIENGFEVEPQLPSLEEDHSSDHEGDNQSEIGSADSEDESFEFDEISNLDTDLEVADGTQANEVEALFEINNIEKPDDKIDSMPLLPAKPQGWDNHPMPKVEEDPELEQIIKSVNEKNRTTQLENKKSSEPQSTEIRHQDVTLTVKNTVINNAKNSNPNPKSNLVDSTSAKADEKNSITEQNTNSTTKMTNSKKADVIPQIAVPPGLKSSVSSSPPPPPPPPLIQASAGTKTPKAVSSTFPKSSMSAIPISSSKNSALKIEDFSEVNDIELLNKKSSKKGIPIPRVKPKRDGTNGGGQTEVSKRRNPDPNPVLNPDPIQPPSAKPSLPPLDDDDKDEQNPDQQRTVITPIKKPNRSSQPTPPPIESPSQDDKNTNDNSGEERRSEAQNPENSLIGPFYPYQSSGYFSRNGRLQRASSFLQMIENIKNENLSDQFRLHCHAPTNNRFYGNFASMDFLLKSSYWVNKLRPGQSLDVNDISAQYGGRIGSVRNGKVVGHASHQNGLDMDIGYFFKGMLNNSYGRNALSKKGGFDPNFDRPFLWKYFKTMMTHYHDKIFMIFVNPTIKQAMCAEAQRAGDLNKSNNSQLDPIVLNTLRRLVPTKGHSNHFHVRLRCPAWDTRSNSRKNDTGVHCVKDKGDLLKITGCRRSS